MEIIKKLNNIIISSLAKTRFKDVPILSPDFSEPIQRPSIKILVSSDKDTKQNSCYFINDKSVKIHYFGVDVNDIRAENMEIGRIIMRGLLTSGITDSVTMTQNDGVLIVECEIETDMFYEEYSQPEAPGEDPPNYDIMEELDINLGGE